MVQMCCVLALMLNAVAQAQDCDYGKSLAAAFPFYKVASTVFAPVYPALARQLVLDYGITKGIAVDLGGAEGSLAMELARITDLKIYNVDINPAAIRLCNFLAEKNKLSGRVVALEADATSLPLRDAFADLVVSRNSIFSWPDRTAGLREAYRILKPGGVAYIGGGFSRLVGPDDLKSMLAWSENKNRQKPDSMVEMPRDVPAQLRVLGITARVIERPTAFDWWLEMRKPAIAVSE